MKSGRSGSSKGIDAGIRRTAEAAARQAGMSLEAWLREAIAQRAAEEGAVPAAMDPVEEDADAESVAATLARLGDQIRAMSARPRNTREAASAAELNEIAERLARDIQFLDETARPRAWDAGRPRGTPRSGGGFREAVRSIEAQIAALAGRARPKDRSDGGYDEVRDQLDTLLARAPKPTRRVPHPPRARADDLQRTVRQLEAQLARAGHLAAAQDGARAARRSPAAGIADADGMPHRASRMPAEADSDPDPLSAAIADISRRQTALSAGASGAEDETPAAIGALRAEVAVLSDRIAALWERGLDERAGYENASARAEQGARAGQESMATIAATLDDIRAVLEGLAAQREAMLDPGDVTGLAAGLAELRAKVEGLEKTGRQGSESLRRLEARLDGIARIDPVALVRGVEARIDKLAAHIDAVVRAPSKAGAIDDIRAEIAAVRLELATRGSKGIDAIERRIRELIEQVAVTSRSDDTRQLVALETRVDGLAADLARATPRTSALDQVEENIARLKETLAEGRKESVEAARAAARTAVRELGAPGAERELLAALRKDLDEVRKLIASADRPSRADEEAMKAKLAAVAERIGGIARDVGAKPPAAPGPSTATPEEPAIPRAEPRSRPSLAAVREVAETVPEADRKTAGRRADFIAAARRAVQAAVVEAEATPDAEGEAAASAADSPFARIGQAIRARRKPLLLAAAAIVLAIGALQMFSRPVETAEMDPASRAIVVRRTASGTAETGPAAPMAMQPEDSLPIPAVSAPAGSGAPVRVIAGSAQPAGGYDAPSIGPESLRAAAAAGDPDAAFEVAARYADGRGTLRDLRRAAIWFQRAADAGSAPAMYHLGSFHERGQGVAKDLPEAMALYQRAAELGNVGAMYNLAVMTSSGAAGVPDPQKALGWFLAAANHGVKDSQYNLGVVYSRGLGTPVDLSEAYKWFAVAAAAGDRDAAAQRDQIAAMLDPSQLANARAAATMWRPQTPPPGANAATAAPMVVSSAPPPLPAAGDRQALVKTVQTLLAAQGYDPGPADGFEGPKTRQAVRAFQRRAGAAGTGIIDASLVTMLTTPTG